MDLLYYLRPGSPDDARAIIQKKWFGKILRNISLEGRALNAGCGQGLYAPFLRTFSKISQTVHCDLQIPPSAPFLNEGRDSFLRASLTDLPFQRESFDFCLCSEVLEHIQEDGKAFSELARVIAKKGFLLVTVPTPPAPPDPHHVREGYVQEDLAGLLSERGLEIKKAVFCFHLFMRIFCRFWEWQFRVIGKEKRSFVPRAFMFFAGALDSFLPIGKPWDLIVLAQKQ